MLVEPPRRAAAADQSVPSAIRCTVTRSRRRARLPARIGGSTTTVPQFSTPQTSQTLEVPTPVEPVTPAVPDAPVTPIDPDPGPAPPVPDPVPPTPTPDPVPTPVPDPVPPMPTPDPVPTPPAPDPPQPEPVPAVMDGRDSDPPGAVSNQNQEEAESGHRDDRTHPEPRTSGKKPRREREADDDRPRGGAGEGSQSTGHPGNAG